jgi:amino acid adenylation domain-containing protein
MEMSDPCASIASLPAEQQAIRAKCFHRTGTFVEFKKEEIERSIPERFEKIARVYPERIAVKTFDQILTYGKLNADSNHLASVILARQGNRAEPVALLFEDLAGMANAMLGVLKAGKFFVLLDPRLPKSRIRTILMDSQAELVIADQQNAQMARELTDAGGQNLILQRIESLSIPDTLRPKISPSAIAYVVYTSGSTGQPKGVIQNHRNLLHRVLVRTNTKHLCKNDSMAHLTSANSNAITNIFLALLNGAKLVPFNAQCEGMLALARWLKRERISYCRIASPLFRRLCEILTGDEKFPDLRLIELTSETVQKSDIDCYKRYFARGSVLSIPLSSTETGLLTEYVITHDIEITGGQVPVGFPAQDKEILLLDETGGKIGHNTTGEIVVRSRYLSPGYWRRPDLTQAKFKPDPDNGEKRLYFGGDLGLMLPDGCLIHKGRKDFRVRVRGHGVETAEVEKALLTHPAVKEVVVMSRQNESGEARLVAYFTSPNQTASQLWPRASQLRSWLKQRVPDYMIPSAFVLLDTMPLTRNGKVDRPALPEPGQSRPELDTPFVAARTLIEEDLAKIWAEVLSLDQLGVHDNFFDLGGHSLAATRVISQVIKRFQAEVPLQALLSAPTVAEMAAMIVEHQARRLDRESSIRMLAEVEQLTDEEARKLLASESNH